MNDKTLDILYRITVLSEDVRDYKKSLKNNPNMGVLIRAFYENGIRGKEKVLAELKKELRNA